MEKVNLVIDAETFPILSQRKPEELMKTIVRLFEFHKMKPTEENIYALLVQLASDLQV